MNTNTPAATAEHDEQDLSDAKTLQEALAEATPEQLKGFVTDLEKTAAERKEQKED